MKHVLQLLILVPVSMLLLAGCMKMGPDYISPEMDFDLPEAYSQVANDPFMAEASVSKTENAWWKAFEDPEINTLVAQALQYNPDIKKTAAIVLELEGRLVQTRSNRFPSIDMGGQAKRSQATVSTTVPTLSPDGGLTFENFSTRVTADSYGLSMPATFELDLWGRLARADEASQADLLQAEENRHAVIQTIAAEVVSLYLKMESLERQIWLNELRIQNFQTGLDLVQKRYTAGLTSALEVRQAKRSLSQVKALQPSLYQALGIAQNNLSILCGKYPQTHAPRNQPVDYYRQLPPVPSGLPSELLLRRPDIRAAEAGLMARNARVGEAMAYRFPIISLTGTFGYASGDLDRLFTPASELWETAAGALIPVFDAGKRKAGENIARARFEQSVCDYAKTVLNAFAEVESALLTRKQQLERRKQLMDFLEEARATQEMAELRYDKGLVDYLTVLDAIQARFVAEEEVILSDLSIWQNRVTLHRALGGGWPEINVMAANPNPINNE